MPETGTDSMPRSGGGALSFAAAIILVAPIGYLDYLTGYRMSFSLFYLVPILWAAWCCGRWAGVLVSLLSMIMWYVAEVLNANIGLDETVGYWNAATRLGFFVVVTHMAASLKLSLQAERRLARIDYLTGVANARAFLDVAGAELERARRYPRPLSLAYIDLDDFKKVNDTSGHGEGDVVLARVGEALRRSVRSTDFAARLGGDEFAVLLPETGAAEAREAVERLRARLIDVVQLGGRSVTLSMGVVTYLSPPGSVEELVRRADSLMYEAKHSGKNSTRFETSGGPGAGDAA